MTKVLIYRFSAMGDVILLLPVIRGLINSNANIEVYLITQKAFFSVFEDIDRLHLIEVDLKGEHRGFDGLFKLYRKVRKEISPDFVFDLHRVLRTYTLNFFFFFSGFKIKRFNKGTFRKYLVIRRKKFEINLPNTVERYAEVFRKAGFVMNLHRPPLFSVKSETFNDLNILTKSIIIGIAPFAKHKQKVWGIQRVEDLILELNRLFELQIIFFGGGHSELQILTVISQKNNNCVVSANHFSFSDEIQIMSKLSMMISMDSANMHLAAMAGVPTISIWGATHPALGFAPYDQPEENTIQYNGELIRCRPCSVYGNKKCIYFGEIRCMNLVSVDQVLRRITQILDAKGLGN